MTAQKIHRLDGLEPDNLLAFLALLGVLRALDSADRNLLPRAAWDVETPPLRPKLVLSRAVAVDEVMEGIAKGIELLSAFHEFRGRKKLNYSREECREILESEAESARINSRGRVDLLAALMCDAAIKNKKDEIDPTALCLLSGQGHQHFLDRLADVPRKSEPPPRGKGKKAVNVSASECLFEALFRQWHRDDPTFSFRWDPEEDVRYAHMPGDPSDPAYKPRTQHGANRLAAIGLGALSLVPQIRAGRVRPCNIGGVAGAGGYSFAWPIWREPASLSAITALLSHPDLREIDALAHLGVESVMVTQRISVGKFMNFTRARTLQQIEHINASR